MELYHNLRWRSSRLCDMVTEHRIGSWHTFIVPKGYEEVHQVTLRKKPKEVGIMIKISDRAAEKYREVAATLADPHQLKIRLYMSRGG